MGKNEVSNEVRDKPDSVTLKRNAKGDLAYDIKCYFSTDTSTVERINKVERIRAETEKIWGKGV